MILGTRIFDELDYERSICITGALSGGKTRLGFDFALHYWRKGYRVIANVPHNYNDYMPVKSSFLAHSHPLATQEVYYESLYNSFVIADEGGEFVRKASLASSITRSAGKADYYTLFTGKRLPHKELQRIVVQPRFDFFYNFGIPAILWLAKINSADPKYKFTFWEILPHEIHGTYSTLSSAGALEKIIKKAERTVQLLAAFEGDEAGQQLEAGLEGLAEDLSSLPFEDA